MKIALNSVLIFWPAIYSHFWLQSFIGVEYVNK